METPPEGLFKRREIVFCTLHPDPDQPGSASAILVDVEGIIETQVVPGMSGFVDYGSYQYVRPLKGSFGVIDEMEDTHGPEASVTGICLVPSLEALTWILRKVEEQFAAALHGIAVLDRTAHECEVAAIGHT